MKSKILPLGIVLAIILGASGIVYATTTKSENQIEAADNEEILKAEWVKTVESAVIATCYGPESVKDDSTEIVNDVAEAEKLQDEYEDNLSEIFTEEAADKTATIYESYADEAATLEERIEDTEQLVSEFLDFGCFETEIMDYDYSEEGDSAVVYALMTVWVKSVSQFDNSEFTAIFPVNKYVKKFDMVLEDGIWKVSNSNIVSSVLMEGDYDLEQAFSTYEDAVAYAASVTPSNVLADSTVEISEYLDGTVEISE